MAVTEQYDGSESQSPTCESEAASFSLRDEQALVLKADLRIVPILSILYLMAFLDRVNISNALTLGLPKELKLVGNEPNIALTIFFVPYVVFEIPSNILLKRLKPHVWLPGCMLVFGVVMLSQGFVRNYSGLLATRFLLGLAEAGVFPGCFYILSMWYKRNEAQLRFSLFFGSATLAGAFGSLLASAIQTMNGVKGYSGWRWIFILEGIATCVLACASYFVIPDFPEDASWLRAEERQFMTKRLSTDDDTSLSPPSRQNLLSFFTSIKTLMGGLMYFGITIPAYGLAYFTPTIVRGYGYGTIATQLHSVPPSAAAWVLSIFVAVSSDRLQRRSPFIAFSLALAIAGSAILITVHHNTPLQYGAIFLVAMGTYSSMPIIICWFTMNLSGHWERSVGTGWMIGFGNIGAIVATFSFTSADAPLYHKGYSILLGGISIVAASSTVYFALIWRERQRGRQREGATHAAKSKAYYL